MKTLKKIYGLLIFTGFHFVFSQSNIDSVVSYYPLHIGDTWQFKSTNNYWNNITSKYYSVKVIGDTMIGNNISYFIIESTPKSAAHPRYQRIDSLTSQVFAIDTSNGGKEYIIDSLLAPAHSVFHGCRNPLISETIVHSIGNKFYFGELHSFRFYVTPAGYIGPSIQYTLINDIGLSNIAFIYQLTDDPTFYDKTLDTLVYAKINGKEYGTLVSVSNEIENPNDFILYQNYPNPFNPATTINYHISCKSFVSLKIYDLLGREIILLVNETQEVGFYSIKYSAGNLSSGIYFYQLNAGNIVATKRLLLLK